MIKRTQSLALLVAAAALLAVPAVGQAHKTGAQHNHGKKGKAKGHSKAQGKSCADKKTVKKGFVVRGTLVSANETSVVITVTGANRHARISGELTDQNSAAPGVQVAGSSYKVDATDDPFRVKLSDYEGTDTPSVGDAVRIVGKVAVTRKKCAAGDTVAERYGVVDIRRVKIADRDAD